MPFTIVTRRGSSIIPGLKCSFPLPRISRCLGFRGWGVGIWGTGPWVWALGFFGCEALCSGFWVGFVGNTNGHLKSGRVGYNSSVSL